MIYKANIVNFFKKHRLDILCLGILSLTFPLFFYKLGQSSLVSWDEAWYAEIARNILKSGDIFNLTFNGKPYVDHPAMGFWLMAISFLLFGVSEFSTKLPSALAGLISIYLIFLFGKELFNRTVGLASGLALSSALWFVYRARSGNLDVFLTCFFILTLFLAIKAAQNKKYLIPLSFSLASLFLTKTLIPLTILPSLAIVFFQKGFFKNNRIKLTDLIYPLAFFLILTSSWFLVQFINYPGFLDRYLTIGLPGVEAKPSYLNNFQLAWGYLHNSIGKWFWPGVLSIIAGLFLLQKRFFILSTFCLVFFIPFVFSARGHIWHLIPLHPFLILSFFGLSYVLTEKFYNLIIKNRLSTKYKSVLISLPILIFSLYFSSLQIRQEWYQFIDINAYVSDEAILAKEASLYPQVLLIDDDWFPAAVFYSEKKVEKIFRGDLDAKLLGDQPFLMITNDWRINQSTASSKLYRIIKKDRDKVLILKP